MGKRAAAPTPQTPDPDLESTLPVGLPVRLVKFPGGVPDLNEAINAMVAADPRAMLRVRIPMTLLDPLSKNYVPMRHNAFSLEFASAAVWTDFRQDLSDFIQAWVSRRQQQARG